MSKDELMHFAKEAGLEDGWLGWCQECGCDSKKLLHFAMLAVLAEREACAKVCDNTRDDEWTPGTNVECAAAIRSKI